jgi:hypothetical protein
VINPSIAMFRVVGYCLLALVAANWLVLALPPDFRSPVWKFETIGAFIEGSPLLLIAFMLIFYGQQVRRKKLELLALNILSNACLVMTILLLLFIPLIFSNAISVNRVNDAQVWAKVDRQSIGTNKVQRQLDAVAPPVRTGQPPIKQSEAEAIEQTEISQEQLLISLTEMRRTILAQGAEARMEKRKKTLKQSLQWSISALIASFTFSYLRRKTQWARVKKISR